MTDTRNRKNVIIAAAMLLVLAAGSLAAYFTSTDEATNTFTVGEVKIDLSEPSWTAPTNITPNQEVKKDPVITNIGVNDAYVFAKVTVPKADIITANTATDAKNDSAVTQLFQLNKTANSDAAKAWTGTDTYNDSDWTLVDTDTSAADVNVYVFAYAKSGACTKLAKDAKTTALFNSVTFCNAVEGQSLENSTKNIKVESFGIQTENLSASDSTAPAALWAILKAQTPDNANGTYEGGAE